MKRKILAAARHMGSAQSIAPIIKKSQEDPSIETIVVAQEEEGSVFSQEHVAYTEISDASIPCAEKILEIEAPDLVLTGTSVQDKDAPHIIEQTLTLAAKRSWCSFSCSDGYLWDI